STMKKEISSIKNCKEAF
ncbi:hypothetical protein CPC698_1177B, partial [Chlamydia psittaci C6/98]